VSGPSGVDAPAPETQRPISDPFRAFVAAYQGDLDRAASIIVRMSGEEFDRFTVAVAALSGIEQQEGEARARAALLAKVTEDMPVCTCPPLARMHALSCPRAAVLGSAVMMRDGRLPGWRDER
jgi:hypothetical protein